MTTSVRKAVHLGTVELRLLLRRKVTAFSVVIVPVGLCALTWFGERSTPPQTWGPMLGQRFMLLMLLSVFLVSTTVFTARRQSLVLKRLRTSELGDAGVIAGVIGPVVAVGVAQVAVYFGFCVAVGAPLPRNPVVVVIGTVLGVVLSVAAGMATASLSKSVEATQITTFPVLLAVMAGMFLHSSSEVPLAVAGSAMPIVGPMQLLVSGWSGTEVTPTLPGLPGLAITLGSTVLWAVVFVLVIVRFFRWEPRS